MEDPVIEIRYDTAPLKVTKNDEGFLTGMSVVTRTGVFSYVNKDGSIRRELRHPEDVFNKDSLQTLKLKPVTNGHPPVLVDKTNSRQYSVGNIGDNVNVDGDHVIISYTIQDKTAIDEVDKGKRQLSLGYRLDREEVSGVYNGEFYTHRQRNIRYNHLAIVDKARAGNVASINVDGEEIDIYELDFEVNNDSRKDHNMNLVDVSIDGLTYKASPEVVKELEKIKSANSNFDSSTTELKANRDKLQANFDAAQEKIKELEAQLSQDSIDAVIASRLELIDKASKFVNADDLKGLSVRDVQEKVIKSKFKDLDLSKKSPEYIEARFDSLIDSQEPNNDEATKVKKALGKFIEDSNNDGQPVVEKDLRKVFNARREEKSKA